MSTPFKIDKSNPIRSVAGELISAMSALNMEPDPIKPAYEDDIFLSQVDAWAKHSMEHMRQAMVGVRLTEKKISELEDEISRLKIRISTLQKEALNGSC